MQPGKMNIRKKSTEDSKELLHELAGLKVVLSSDSIYSLFPSNITIR